jgi:hypothetical protein
VTATIQIDWHNKEYTAEEMVNVVTHHLRYHEAHVDTVRLYTGAPHDAGGSSEGEASSK